MNFLQLDRVEDRLQLMRDYSKKFGDRSADIDERGSFPFENIKELKDSMYTSLTLPQQYGGKEISLYELVRLQEIIAEGDGPTALSIGWHMGIIKNLTEKSHWQEATFQMVSEAIREGALINSAATEAQTGSPTRGGKPTTTAEKRNGKWLVKGRKTFTTMAPVLNFFIVSATIKDSDQIGNFLIPRTAEGIQIDETWDSIAMRGTASHDLILENVLVDGSAFVEEINPMNKQANGWLLHIPACYLGIARAAQKYAIQFAKFYSPSSLSGSIIELPNVKQKIGEMELLILQSSYFLYSVAKQWDESSDDQRKNMQPELGAVKLNVTNSAIAVVDLAMRIVGARSLSAKNPLQRYYRDVRAGLHNPPMDDMTIMLLANNAIRSNLNNERE